MSAPSKRRFGVGSMALAAAVGALLFGAGAYWLGRESVERPTATATASDGEPARAAQAPAERWQCPMHPSVVQDHPGNCPICGMKLVKMSPAEPGQSAQQGGGERKILFYRSPMDPKVTSSTPKKDEMGMDYVPVYEDEASGAAASNVPGQATVDIDPARQQLIGLTTAQVTAGPVGGAWRTTGRVAIDETRVRHVNVKVPGFVERVYVDFVGKAVKKGDPLFSIYSPELLSAQQEYLLALRTRGAAGGEGEGEALVQAARRKLELWDVPKAELDRIARTGQPSKTLTLASPVSGVVTKKEVVDGMKLEAGAMPYEIVDLSQVWVLADVYETELQYVREGLAATLTLNAFPGREFKGRVRFVDPLLDPQTRTVKVRLAFPNAEGALRPEMFGEVVLQGPPREGLRIPQDAVVDSGTEKYVFVAVGSGKFEPRRVGLGAADGNLVEVRAGLKAGEQVVTRANFLVDSESKLRSSLAAMTTANAAAPKVPESARVLPGAAPPQTGQGGTGGTGGTGGADAAPEGPRR
ncbi:MAG: efflux RND transporter periplasmic adaptor subunit [Myxococcales bacterium]